MARKKRRWSEEADRFLKEHYDPLVKGRSAWIAKQLGVPRWAVNQRAVVLGLSRVKDRPWTPEEEAYMEEHYHRMAVKTVARRLGRSVTAIRQKAKRLGMRKHGEGYTAYSLAQALGVDPHWVMARIRSGLLRASQRNTERTAAQGDSWLVTDEAVVAFVREHPYELNLRKVDGLWFLDLVAAWLKDPGASSNGRSPTCAMVNGKEKVA